MKKNLKKFEPLFFLIVFFIIFGALGSKMGVPNMLNTLMNTSYKLLLETVFYIMGITVLSGALGKILVEFGVVGILEKILRPLMKPLWNLPGVAALGGVLTFLSDNPAIITLANDKNFSKKFPVRNSNILLISEGTTITPIHISPFQNASTVTTGS